MADYKTLLDRTGTDPAFRARFLADAAAVLREAGVDVPPGAMIEVIDPRPGEVHLFLGTRSTAPALDRVLVRAGVDAAFKQRLLTDPKAAVEEATGEKLPAAARVHVHEPALRKDRIVLPAAHAAEGELSDVELEAVAGGGLFARVLDAVCRNTDVAGEWHPSGNEGSYRFVFEHRSGTMGDPQKEWA